MRFMAKATPSATAIRAIGIRSFMAITSSTHRRIT